MAPGRRSLRVAAEWLLLGGNARWEERRRLNQRGKRYDFGLRWLTPSAARHTQPPFVEHLGGGAGFLNVMRLYPSLGIGVGVMGNATTYDIDAVARLSLNLR